MAIRTSRYFNDPAFAQAASNIAALFAPPSGAEAAGWAAANAKKEEAARLAQFFDYASDPNFDQTTFDRLGVGAGAYNPNQSYYSVDQGNATTRRGQDVVARTSRLNNADDNARALRTNQVDNLTKLFGPLSQGEMRPEMPADLAAALGLDSAVPPVAGLPKPLSESEVKGRILANMDPEMRDAIVFGNTAVENVVTPNGPRIATRMDAVGQEPYINKGATAKPENAIAVLADGSRVPAIQGEDGKWHHAQTGEPLPIGIQIFGIPKPQGSAEDVGLTTAMQSNLQGQKLSAQQTRGTAAKLRDMIASSPSSQGLVGSIRGTAQDVIQTGGDLGQFFGGQVKVIEQDVRKGLMDAGMAAENFDPNIPAIQMLTNLLAWQYAKSLSGDRVSNEQLRQAREAIGGSGIFANRANSLARLDELIARLDEQIGQIDPLTPGVNIGGSQPGAPAAEEEWVRGPDGTLQRR